ncbi:hypothetical protein EBO34_00795 [Alteribacter keqinensis]|uniref:Uncharacterized protein n=1 Tax=Alteribacter keqinensis TaxID=2483800 RepID=A0A3M7TSX3_9BACI|nr:hypothetical protein EBO34_00795 [Alteribacter keqinensis]
MDGFLLEGVIDQKRYCNLISQLIIMGYRYIEPPSDVFIYYLDENNLENMHDFNIILEVLSKDSVNKKYILLTSFEILKWIWKSTYGIESKIQITLLFKPIFLKFKQPSLILREFVSSELKGICKAEQREIYNIIQTIDDNSV